MSKSGFKVGRHKHRWVDVEHLDIKDRYQVVAGEPLFHMACPSCGADEWRPVEEHMDDTTTFTFAAEGDRPEARLTILSARQIEQVLHDRPCLKPDACESDDKGCQRCEVRALSIAQMGQFIQQNTGSDAETARAVAEELVDEFEAKESNP